MKLYFFVLLTYINNGKSQMSQDSQKKDEFNDFALRKEWSVIPKKPLRNEKLYKPILEKETNLIFDTWGNCKLALLYCRNGFYINIQNNKVVGMFYKSFITNETGLFQIETYSKSFVMLKHAESNRYIAMNKEGKLQTSETKTDECLFYYYLEKGDYATFSSAKYFVNEYYDLYISLRKTGKIRKANHSTPFQRSSQFEILPKKDRLCIRR